jgi:hypothetical protein
MAYVANWLQGLVTFMLLLSLPSMTIAILGFVAAMYQLMTLML